MFQHLAEDSSANRPSVVQQMSYSRSAAGTRDREAPKQVTILEVAIEVRLGMRHILGIPAQESRLRGQRTRCYAIAAQQCSPRSRGTLSGRGIMVQSW